MMSSFVHQFNCISLGFTVGAVAAICLQRDYLASTLFCLALNHKQVLHKSYTDSFCRSFYICLIMILPYGRRWVLIMLLHSSLTYLENPYANLTRSSKSSSLGWWLFSHLYVVGGHFFTQGKRHLRWVFDIWRWLMLFWVPIIGCSNVKTPQFPEFSFIPQMPFLDPWKREKEK